MILYKKNKKYFDEYPAKDLLLRYVLIKSRDLPRGFDLEKYGSAFALLQGTAGINSRIFICKDLVRPEYNRYLAIHETVEAIYFNHYYALQIEFEAAEAEMPAEAFTRYCRYRFKDLLDKQNNNEMCYLKKYLPEKTRFQLSQIIFTK